MSIINRIIIATILAALATFEMFAQSDNLKLTEQNKSQNKSQGQESTEEDPCNPPKDDSYGCRPDLRTGHMNTAVPDTSYIGLCNRNVMESKAMSVVYTSNLYSPHLINQYFARKDDNDFIFANAYSLFAASPADQIYYNTKIPFTVASYTHSGATMQANDHLLLDFAGNIKPNIGIGTKLDYIYARGEYVNSSTKPLKWLSYLYYQGTQYKAYASFNVSKYGNQEWGGITDREYVLHPDNYNDNFTTPRTMPTKLVDTWNDTDYRNIHFTHSYDLGRWEERQEEGDTVVWDEFIPVATIFHNIDFQSYDHSFRMASGADQTEKRDFFTKRYYSVDATNDSTRASTSIRSLAYRHLLATIDRHILCLSIHSTWTIYLASMCRTMFGLADS